MTSYECKSFTQFKQKTSADSDYFARYYADLAAKVPELTAASGREGALNAYKSTDNSRVILALSAIGRDAAQVGGCDLTAPYLHG